MSESVLQTCIALYRRGWSMDRISWDVHISRSTIRRQLERAGVIFRHRAARGICCVDCRKPIATGKRCVFHRKIRKAQLNREFNRAKFGWKARIEC